MREKREGDIEIDTLTDTETFLCGMDVWVWVVWVGLWIGQQGLSVDAVRW